MDYLPAMRCRRILISSQSLKGALPTFRRVVEKYKAGAKMFSSNLPDGITISDD